MTPTFCAAWQPALDLSPFLRRLLTARPELAARVAALWEVPLSEDVLRAGLSPEPPDEVALKGTLRRVRQLAMAVVGLRDLTGRAPLAEVVESMSMLADVTTNFALDWHHRQLAAQTGEPLDSQGQPQRLIVIGMGKLGGRELNVSSDVDYIFVYPEEGHTAGPRVIDNYDFFTRLGRRLIAALNDLTDEGQVFRVDMRLRPNGDSGPLVGSLDALENYFIAQGREWERYAWIKGRIMNTGANAQPAWMEALRRIAHPFVYRKYLDFGAINAMRDLHAQIRREVARKDRADHIKLGPGGIREIEFIAQVFQLIRGGCDPLLRVRPTLSVLAQLAERQLISRDTEQALRAAYLFLRRLEHRLQWVEDQQTHMLPTTPGDQATIARAMGYDDWTGMLAELDRHRQGVARQFEQVFSDPIDGEHALTGLWLGQLDAENEIATLFAYGIRQPLEAVARLATLRQSGRYQQLPASNRERLDALGPRLIEAASGTANPDATLTRGLNFLETISRRGAYLSLLQQYPLALKKVADVVGASSWAAEYLTRHPLLLDELLDPRLMETATDWTAFRTDLRTALENERGDAEREMDVLREIHHAQVFRLLVQDIAGLHTIERISDHLTELADIMIGETLSLVWQKIARRHRDTPRFAIIGYGKLGGKELGYASDLDMVYLYEDDHPDASENYMRLGQRLNTWLSSQTAAGVLFEADLRLRPNGESGLLAVSIDAFRDYQLQHAWVWEHQALTRARFCAGDAAIGQRFEAIRREILCQPRDLDHLREEVLTMRQRMLGEHASTVEGEFDLKQDAGGIIDVEFIVQYLVLGYAHRFPQLTGNLGNIALLAIAADCGLIDRNQADAVRTAYREYRRLQHLNRLNAQPSARLASAVLHPHITAVTTLWRAVFGQ